MDEFQYTPTGWSNRHYLPELLKSGQHIVEGEGFLARFSRLVVMKSRWMNYLKPFADSIYHSDRAPDSKEKRISLHGNIRTEDNFTIKGNSFLLFVALFSAFEEDFGSGLATPDLGDFLEEALRQYEGQEWLYQDDNDQRIEATHDTNFKFCFKTGADGDWVKVSMPEAFKIERYFSH